MRFFTTWLISTTVNTGAQFIGKYVVDPPFATDVTADINEAGEFEYTMVFPGQRPVVSARYPLVEGGPEKYFVDFQAKDGGSFSDFQIRSTTLGLGLSMINFDGPNSLRIRSENGFVAFTRAALPLSQGTYFYSEGDSFKMTMEVAAQSPKEVTRTVKMTVNCSLGGAILLGTQLSTAFELDERPIAAAVSATVGDFFTSAGQTCSRTDLLTNDNIFVVATATETRECLQVGESTVFALDKVQ
ncbi:hypothetical protein FOZ60_011725 [Perkinsus olseni]|nr:hypothetical protein FOZ60_011725 [Perkinsus olseni]